MPSVCFLLAVVDVFTELTGEGVFSDSLYADDLVLMRETFEGLRNKFRKLKEAFKCKGLKVDLRKAKDIVSGGITKDDISIKLTHVGSAA